MIPLIVFPGQECPYVISLQFLYYLYVHSQLSSHNIQNMVHIIILYYFLLCEVHLMQGFIYEKVLQGNQNYSQDRSFLTVNEENPALILSNLHNRTSSRDGPIFGSKGLSMNTTSLGITARLGASQSFREQHNFLQKYIVTVYPAVSEFFHRLNPGFRDC